MKAFFSLIWRGWKKFAHGLGIVNTKILLTLTYFIIMAIAAIIAYLVRADLLDRRMRKEASYWRKRERVDISIDACRRQF
jgi:hypothetical protein